MKIRIYHTSALNVNLLEYQLGHGKSYSFSKIFENREEGIYYVFEMKYHFLNKKELVCVKIKRPIELKDQVITEMENKFTNFSRKITNRLGIFIHEGNYSTLQMETMLCGVKCAILPILSEPSSTLEQEYLLAGNAYYIRPSFQSELENDMLLFSDVHLPLLEKACHFSGFKYSKTEKPVIMKCQYSKQSLLGNREDNYYKYSMSGKPVKFLKTVSIVSRNGFDGILPLLVKKC